jgi:hypothetical protein
MTIDEQREYYQSLGRKYYDEQFARLKALNDEIAWGFSKPKPESPEGSLPPQYSYQPLPPLLT